MINLTRFLRILTVVFLSMLITVPSYGESKTIDKVTITYEVLSDGTARLISARNRSSRRVYIKIDGRETATLNAGDVNEQGAQINRIAKKRISFDYSNSSGPTLWRYTAPAPAPAPAPAAVVQETQPTREPEVNYNRPTPVGENKNEGERNVDAYQVSADADGGDGYPSAIDHVNHDPFFGTAAVESFVRITNSYTKDLSQSQDKTQFLIDNDLERFINESETEIKLKKSEIPAFAREIILTYRISDSDAQTTILNSVIEILNNRLGQRESALSNLKSEVDSIPVDSRSEHSLKDSIINYSIIGTVVLVLVLLVVFAVRKKKNKNKAKAKAKAKSKRPADTVQPQQDSDPNNPAIVVRRRTTSMLKKQSIDDVIDNPEYMLINSSEFTPDSAVRNIYVKNTCIKEVYNMYAEDLRDSNNPKEDGCMVLGRWVHNEADNTYDISLETVVFPGDDAVFKEYELNFGGKIKLRIAEKLRKLRRETNLQYDLVCWIHSHPGLGVFFSNSDDNVQMQLKHSQHPNFLIAFVVDILTSNQELGIFTFRKDGSMNSKGDLTKLYSLEDMYKWTLESDKASFNPDNYHNILGSAKMRLPTCNGIELNNSSIIDLTQIVVEPANGIVGWAVGTTVEVKAGREYVISSIVKAEERPTAGVVGVLLNVTHMSLPTIQRLISNENSNLSFALVYSSRQNTLTSIPVINGELITNENFYGEETIDDLKVWTRRKR